MCLCACIWRVRRWNCRSSYGGYAWKPFFRFYRPDLRPCLPRCVSEKILIDVNLYVWLVTLFIKNSILLTRYSTSFQPSFQMNSQQTSASLSIFLPVFQPFVHPSFQQVSQPVFQQNVQWPFHQISFESLHFSRRHHTSPSWIIVPRKLVQNGIKYVYWSGDPGKKNPISNL